MEPFLTRDGRYLLFNNSNAVPSQTDLHWAERIDDLTFEYRGRLEGANSPDLDAVASVDSSGSIFFITTRSYAQNLITIYRGKFEEGIVRDAAPVPGARSPPVREFEFSGRGGRGRQPGNRGRRRLRQQSRRRGPASGAR